MEEEMSAAAKRSFDVAQEPSKRRRLNFSNEELRVLVEEVTKRKRILVGRQSNTIPNVEKLAAWADITDLVNSVSLCSRTCEEVRKKFVDFKSIVKREATRRMQAGLIGDETSKAYPLSELEKLMLPLVISDLSIEGVPGPGKAETTDEHPATDPLDPLAQTTPATDPLDPLAQTTPAKIPRRRKTTHAFLSSGSTLSRDKKKKKKGSRMIEGEMSAAEKRSLDVAEEPSKRRRLNFSNEELRVIVEEVAKRKQILVGRQSYNISSVDKDDAWADITDLVNCVSSCRRTSEEVRKKFIDFKSIVKKEATRRSQDGLTGDETSNAHPLSELEELMLPLVMSTFGTEGIPGPGEAEAADEHPAAIPGPSAQTTPDESLRDEEEDDPAPRVVRRQPTAGTSRNTTASLALDRMLSIQQETHAKYDAMIDSINHISEQQKTTNDLLASIATEIVRSNDNNTVIMDTLIQMLQRLEKQSIPRIDSENLLP